jgi:phospholipid/cholesterol/gamma-HCH transport system substrate-binding protein
MKRASIITWEQLRVGGVIVAGLLVIGVAVWKIGKAANLFSRHYELVVYVPAANGLREGGSVTLAGQLVGTVKKIDFLPVDFDTTRNLRIVVRIDRNLQQQVRKDSKASLKTMGLLGDKVLDITPGTPRYAVLSPGDTIRVAPSLDYEDVLAKAASAVDDVVGLTRDLHVITGGLRRGEGTMGQFLTNRAMYDEMTGAMARANVVLASFQNPNGTFGRLLNDPALYNRMTEAVASLDSMLVAMNSSQGSLGLLMRDTTLYANLSHMAASADSLMTMLGNQNGVFAKLTSDGQLYDQLNKLTSDLNSVLADVRRDPHRYTKGLICVLNCK